MRWKLALSLALLAAVACGEPPAKAPPPPPDAGDKPVEQRPTEEQERALANLLHEKHVESKEEEIKCRACHRISGHEKADVKHRCLECHEDNKSKVHAKVADDMARECQTCHDFLAKEVNAWACGSCHVAGAPNLTTIENLPDAPKVEIHGKEACKSCHIPHGDEPLEPGTCVECHDDVTVKHEEKGKKDPEQCLTCHGGHEEGKAAKAKCATCHDGVPKAATFDGHDRCTTCHQPHERGGVKACASCHDDQHTVGMQKSEEHAKCNSCHAAHVVKTTPSKRCTKCHEDVAVAGHPDDDKRGACAGCHPQHEWRGQLTVVRTCAGKDCHAVAGETAFHSGVDCKDCHPKHEYAVEGLDKSFCNKCHGTPRKGKDKDTTATQVTPVSGHDECKDCHEKGAHAPRTKPVACASCHEDQKAQMTKGHEDCAQCHQPHEGSVQKDCKSCHDDKLLGRHTAKETRDCATCHRPHGPDGVTEPKACKSCHEDALPGLHSIKDHGRCDDCHGFHDKAPRRGRTTCLGSCHQDQVDHEPTAKSCAGCHPFEKELEEKTR